MALKLAPSNKFLTETNMEIELYYLQDSRTYDGSLMLFWAKDGGYTSDLNKARVFRIDQALSMQERKKTDVLWPKSYLDKRMSSVIDIREVIDEQAQEIKQTEQITEAA